MTLAKTVIYESAEQLRFAAKNAPDELNRIDEYGYTPLIQSAIVNDPEKTKILLDAGAEVDLPDLTGRTALFWAADNQNETLTKLLLDHGASPNSYSAGGQPVLVMPLMKNAAGVNKLLWQAGAQLSFAQDFLNAKLIGHSFELEGRIDIVDTANTFIEVELEGFYINFTVAIVGNLINEFIHHFAARTYKHYAPYLNTVFSAFTNASKLLTKQDYLTDIAKFNNEITKWLSVDPLILPVAFNGHAISLIKAGDYLIRCDRGAFGAKHGAVIFYHLDHPSSLDLQLKKDLLYRRQESSFVNETLVERLGLHPVFTLELPLQITGNCSWANIEAVLPSLLLALIIRDKTLNPSILEATKREMLDFFSFWQSWRQERELTFAIQSMDRASAARKAAKAALLATILVQHCKIERQIDQVKIERILKVLSKDALKPALDSFVKVLSKEPQHPLWLNLQKILEAYGLKASD